MNDGDQLRGRAALVFGGSSGIGLASGRALAQAGARVVLAARGIEAGERAQAALEAEGLDATFVQADVRDDASVRAAVAHTVALHGRLDIAVNSAGAGGDMQPLERASLEVWDEVMATNARGVFVAMRHEVDAMLHTGGGAIVNVSSIYGLAGRAAHHAYVASKHAVVGMTRSVALELAPRGIRVNAVCAGVTRTAAMAAAETAWPDAVAGLVAEHPIGRMASEQEIASTVLFLCTPGAGYITGAPIAVDGGFLAA